MALSGNFITSDSGQGGGNYFGRLVFEWWRDSWGRSGGVGYHNISYTLKTYGGSSGYWQYCYNNSMNVDGTGYSRGQTQAYGAGATTILSGSKTLYTDGAGNRSFGASAQAGIYTAAVNTSGSGSWALDNIPMYATISALSGSITDEATNVYLSYSNPTGSACTFDLFVRPLGSTGSFTQILNYANYSSGANVAGSVNWALLRSTLASATQGQLIYRITNNVGNTDYGWGNEAIATIINANPTFTTATYKDANAATVAITGNDQYLIQGYSTLEAKILAANKAVALKSATMVKYNMAISSINQDVTYSASDITQNLGTLGIGVNGTLNIKAIDTRNNFTTVPLTVQVLPYVVPQITATAQRVNNFETSTNFHIEGVISRLTIAGTDKNTVNSTNGVRYRYKKTTDVSWGSWVNVASTTTTGNVTTTDFNVPTALDRNYAWNIQVEITDKLNTSTADILLPVGIPIFRIGLDGKIYNNEVAVLPMVDEDDFASNTDQKVPTQQSVRQYVKGRTPLAMMTINYNNSPFSMSWGTAWTGVKVPFNQVNSEYDPDNKLTMNSNGIQVGAGVSKIKITGTFNWYNNGGQADMIPQFWKNSTNLGTSAYENAPVTSNYMSTPLSPVFLDVAQNDIIYMYCVMSATGARSIFGNSTLCVEVIA